MSRDAHICRDGSFYRIRAPYNKAFIEDLKDRFYDVGRWYDQETKEWFVKATHHQEICEMVSEYFPYTICTNCKHCRSPTPTNGVDSFSRIVAELPTEARKAAYKAVMSVVHPDKGGSTQLCQRVSEAWSECGKA